MSETLPMLRGGLDVMPSPVEETPGLILRDPFRYTTAVLVVPPAWVPALAFLDGEHTDVEMQAYLTRAARGEIVFEHQIREFLDTLREHGFLETVEFHRMRDRRHEEFRQASEREAAFAGQAYPADAAECRRQLLEWSRGGSGGNGGVGPRAVGLAAPHVSPAGGVPAYADAYRNLDPGLRDRTFVVLGTSHYGEPEKFGLTRKPYQTPLGRAEVDLERVDRLAACAPDAVVMEDYCHAVEHSIEFQVLFLQQALGPDVRVLPILCGPLAASLRTGQPPETDTGVGRFIDALAHLADSDGEALFWVLGVDLSHIGTRYGDRFRAEAGRDRMVAVEARDRERLERISVGDGDGFFDLVRVGQDELRWCGYSPLYVFLRAMERAGSPASGRLLRYDQWNIDPSSVVSFAALEFFRTD